MKDCIWKGPIISIIVPVYNAEKHIKRCIDSIRCQSYKNLQIVLVDDGSSDSSGKICDEFARIDDRIVVIHQLNQGPVVARAVGVRHSIGQYIGFVDADDYCDEQEYEEMLTDIEKYDADFVHYGYIKETGVGSMKIAPTEKEECIALDSPFVFISQRVLKSTHRNSISPSMWSKLFKRELILSSVEQIPCECQYGEDLINLILCSLNAKRVLISPKAFYHYVNQEGSLMNQIDNELDREARLYVWIRNLFESKGILSDYQSVLNSYFEKKLLSVFSNRNNDSIYIRRYGIKDPIRFDEQKVIIYGAGNVGRDVYRQLLFRGKSNIVGVVDANYEKIHVEWTKVRSVDDLRSLVYDRVLIAVFYESAFGDIREKLIQKGVPDDKIEWCEPVDEI